MTLELTQNVTQTSLPNSLPACNLLKNKVGATGLEPMTSTVSR
jgi:hypothetical protein